MIEKLGRPPKVLILGPGYCLDIPLAWLLKNSQAITMIDGDLEPARRAVKKLNSLESAKITWVKADLTGGFYNFWANAQEEIEAALIKDYLSCWDNNDCSFPEYTKLLEQRHFFVDLAQYKPDLVISSIVTSQLVDPDIAGNLVINIRHKVQLTEKSDVNGQRDIISAIAKTENSFELGIEAAALKAAQHPFWSAIQKSGATSIYYSHDNLNVPKLQGMTDENFDHPLIAMLTCTLEHRIARPPTIIHNESFDQFIKDIELTYNMDKEINTYNYKNNLVSIYTFTKKILCASCSKLLDNPLRCAKCKSIYYCDKGCQKTHWPTHKPICKEPSPW